MTEGPGLGKYCHDILTRHGLLSIASFNLRKFNPVWDAALVKGKFIVSGRYDNVFALVDHGAERQIEKFARGDGESDFAHTKRLICLCFKQPRDLLIQTYRLEDITAALLNAINSGMQDEEVVEDLGEHSEDVRVALTNMTMACARRAERVRTKRRLKKEKFEINRY